MSEELHCWLFVAGSSFVLLTAFCYDANNPPSVISSRLSGLLIGLCLFNWANTIKADLAKPLEPAPFYHRARAIRTQGQEPAVLLRFRLEPSKAPVQHVEVREDLA